MNKILFLCTGNYYRSRVAEELFNHNAQKKKLNWFAESRALADEDYLRINEGPISPNAVEFLKQRNIPINGQHRMPETLKNRDLSEYKIIVCMDRDEHYPIVQQQPNLSLHAITFWDIKDLNAEASSTALSRLEENVNKLIRLIKSGNANIGGGTGSFV